MLATIGSRVRRDPIAALVWIEAAATLLALLAQTGAVFSERAATAANLHLYPYAAACTVACVAAAFAIPHAPNRRFAAIAVACVALVAVGWLPPPGVLLFVLAAILAARLTFAFGVRGAATAWIVACIALAARVYAQTAGANAAETATSVLVLASYAILLALIFGMIALLKVYAASSAESAAANERSRIALDLHDFLGHGLTALRVQLQNAERYRYADPAKADEYVERAAASSAELLADVRETVALLHGAEREAPSFAVLFDRLCREFASTYGTLVDGRAAVAREPSGRLTVALYRTLQEALTNVARHAGAKHVWVTVRDEGQSIECSVEDDGCGMAPEEPRAGHGLISMRERIAGVGGTLSVGARAGGGTVVRATVPMEAGR